MNSPLGSPVAPSPTETSVLSICDVGFRYGRRQVLDGVTATLGVGVTGLLGPNGAGKSTLMRVLATIVPPHSGSVSLGGISVHGPEQEAMRRRIGFLPQRFDLMRWSSVIRNVSYAAWAQGIPRMKCDEAAARALEVVDLAGLLDRRVNTLSGGQQQRVGIACAIAHDPTFVILDEPTAGLDPAQRVTVRDYLAEFATDRVVLVSTHITEDLADAERVLVLDQGRLVFDGPVSAFEGTGPFSARMSPLESAYARLLESGDR